MSMTRPVAALSSDLLVRKGSARPLGLELTERSPHDVALPVRPGIGAKIKRGAAILSIARPAGQSGPGRRRLGPLSGFAAGWDRLSTRWGLPTILFLAGFGMIATVAVTGPGTAPGSVATYVANGPHGPLPVTWPVDWIDAPPATGANAPLRR